MSVRRRSVHTVRVRANFHTLLLKLQYLQSVKSNPIALSSAKSKFTVYDLTVSHMTHSLANLTKQPQVIRKYRSAHLGESSLQFT